MTHEEKMGMLRQLFEMTLSDGEIKPVEYKFLYEIALSLEVPLEDLEEMIEREYSFKLPKQFDERIVQIYRLALMMKVDKEIAEQEVNMLKSMALQLGLHPEAVDTLLQAIKEKSDRVLSFDELEQIFRVGGN